MKLCKDCKYFRVQYRECSYEQEHSTAVDPVTGDKLKPLSPCSLLRQKGYSCGPDAKLFEPLPTFWTWFNKRLFEK